MGCPTEGQEDRQKKLFLYTNTKAGHSGASGRFDSLKELARKFAFIICLEEIVFKKVLFLFDL